MALTIVAGGYEYSADLVTRRWTGEWSTVWRGPAAAVGSNSDPPPQEGAAAEPDLQSPTSRVGPYSPRGPQRFQQRLSRYQGGEIELQLSSEPQPDGQGEAAAAQGMPEPDWSVGNERGRRGPRRLPESNPTSGER